MNEERTIIISETQKLSYSSDDDTEDYSRIFHSLPVAVIEIDYEGVIHKLNKKASDLLNLAPDHILSSNFGNFIYQKDVPILARTIETIINEPLEEFEPFEVRIEPENCELITTHVTPTLLDIPAKQRALLAIEDITCKKQDQAEFERYFEELQITRDDLEERTNELAILNAKLYQSEIQLEEMNKNKDKFFSLISHDLRSPFNSLFGLTKLVYEDFDSFSRDEIKDSLYNIQKVSEGVYNLIEDLLNWSRIQFNNIKFAPQEFSLFLEVTKLVNTLKSVAKDKNISVVNVVPKELYMNADLHMITSILRNLINNSIKFTPKYGLIKISAVKNQEITEISVEDNGIGIRPEKLNKLFKIGSNISSSGTEGEIGTGLGLVLCREFVNQHGGEIWVESEKDHGSKFTFTIPAKAKIDEFEQIY